MKRFFAIPRYRLARSNGLEKSLSRSQKKELSVFLSLILSIYLYNETESFNLDYIKKCL